MKSRRDVVFFYPTQPNPLPTQCYLYSPMETVEVKRDAACTLTYACTNIRQPSQPCRGHINEA